MPYKVTVSGEVAAQQPKDAGTRRRCGLRFGRSPIYLERVPRQIAEDPHLKVEEVGAEALAAAGGRVTPLPGDEVRLPERQRDLLVLARRWRLPEGRKEELASRIEHHVRRLLDRGKVDEVRRALAEVGAGAED